MTGIDNNKTHTYGDRHLRGDLDGRLSPLGMMSIRRVRLSANEAISTTAGGQHTIWMLANLLARQYAVIQEIHLIVPAVPLLPHVALFGEAVDLRSTISNTIHRIAGSHMSILTYDEPNQQEVDAEILVGYHQNVSKASKFQISVMGSGWNLFVGTAEGMPRELPDSTCSFGPYFGACIAAGEVFKFLRGMKEGKGRYVQSLFMSLWDFKTHERWEELPAEKRLVSLQLPPCYLIGAGAVGQAAAATLATAGGLSGHIIVIDDDKVDSTNLNRYPLTTLDDEGKAKSAILSDHLNAKGFRAYPNPVRWPDYAYNLPHEKLPEHLKLLEAEYKYRLVLSCVDKNVARHAIQHFWPEYILGSSTKDMGIAVAAYDMLSSNECIMCNNPLNLDNSTIEKVAEELKRMSPELRRSHAEIIGADLNAVEDYLAHPKCGHLGEQEILKFRADNQGTEWSVGFVSVGAGTLLAAQLVKYALLGRAALLQNSNTLRFSFLNPKPHTSRHLRKDECECSTNGRDNYNSIWNI